MIDKFIALLLIVFSFLIFIGKAVDIFMFILVIALVTRIILSKNNRRKIIIIGSICIVILNYIISQKYFIYGLQYLTKEGTIQYGARLVGLIAMFLLFWDTKSIGRIYRYIEKNKNIVLLGVIISQIYIVYLLISGKGYNISWQMKSFVGPYGSAHLYCYSLIVMIVLIEWLYIVKNKKSILILYIVPLFTSLLTGARTPTIALIGVFILIRFMKKGIKINVRVKFNYFKLIIFIFIMLLLILNSNKIYEFIINSNFIEKFRSTVEEGNILNGRNIFWSNLYKEYLHQNALIQLFGNGIYYTVFSNYRTLGWQIWAHCDFLDILISFGLILVAIYTILYVRYFYKLKVNKSFSLPLFCIIFLLSTFNGVVNYSNFIAIICYIGILVYSINYDKNET